jgi:peptide chain release factor 1
MYDRLVIIEKQYLEIQNKLSSGTLDVKEMTKLLKESSNIADIVSKYQYLKTKQTELEDLEQMLEIEKDEEILDMVSLEVDQLKEILEKTLPSIFMYGTRARDFMLYTT